ncbi:ABC transporter substrate-binding protein [Pseudothermotoga sp.]|nr:sugar ABC transporter substrate-binding protein [Pseudothermotoga sp.]MCX7812176.1 sugar ABC transporter substrate-binding protein [Pseudothermotoga sp.]MDW8139246.1 sugar ABC transporter substrate-binding protein [Pseudothermotoga sp.]
MGKVAGLLVLLVSVVLFADTVLMWFTDGPDFDLITAQTNKFTKQTGEKVVILNLPYYLEYKPKLAAMAKAGSPPDVARETDLLPWVEYAIDLKPLVEKYTGMKFEDWLENVSFYKAGFKKLYEKYGKVVGIPYTSDAHAIFYNKEIFKKAGIEPPKDRPWTIDEWYAAMKKIKQSGAARYALVYDFSPYRFANLLYVFGGGIWDRQGKNIIIDSRESIEALEFFVKLHDEDLIPKAVWLTGDAPAKYFQNGLAAMYVSGTWMLAQFREQLKFDWGVIMWPYKRERAVMTGGKYIVPFTERGAALAFFLTNPENLTEFAGKLYLIPDRKDLADKVKIEDPIINEVYAVVMKDLAESTRGSMVPDWYDPDTAGIVQTNRTVINDHIKAAIAKEKTPEQAFKDLATILRKAAGR